MGKTGKNVVNVPPTGKKFTKDNQPTPEQKSKGWKELRAERHLTQGIIKTMLGEDGTPNDSFKTFLKKLVANAEAGNPKAIDVVAKCLEDDIIKVAQTDGQGNDAKTELSDSQLEKLLHAITKPG